MPFVAVCPYCRAGGVRAPDHAVGASATCPNCRSNFTVHRDEPLPGRGAAVAETATHAAAADVTEPSPVLDDAPAPRPPAPTATAVVSAAATEAAADTALVVALGGLMLFGLGMAATLVPFGRAIGLGLCVFGLLAGLAALGGEKNARRAGWTAAALNLVAAAVLLFAPAWLGLDPWFVAAEEPPPAPAVVGHGGAAPDGADPSGVIPAERASWTHDDLRVTVRPTAVGPVELAGPDGAKKKGRESLLLVTVRLTNTGSKRAVPLSGWAAGEAAGLRLTDPSGKALVRKTFEPGWRPAGAPKTTALAPGNPIDLPFAFEPPASRTESLRLVLDGAALGEPGAITFRIAGPFARRP